jgi:hypothetical protein
MEAQGESSRERPVERALLALFLEQHQTRIEHAHPFLILLDHFVDRGPERPGFEGAIAVVLRTKERDLCWVALFTETKRVARVLANMPREVDAVLLINEDEARAIALEGKAPGALPFAGDRTLFDRFVKTYLEKSTMISLRAAVSAKDKARRRKKR